MNRDVTNLMIGPETSIEATIQSIDQGKIGLALVRDEHGKLVGTVTDGDIRRAILRRLSLETPIRQVMCTTFTVARIGTPRSEIVGIMRRNSIRQIPLVDEEGVVRDVMVLDHAYVTPSPRGNPVVIVAGGQGQRLRPLTSSIPKPMLPIGGRPLLEVMVRRLVDQGFCNLFISVNYLAEVVMEHFGDGDRFGARVTYLEEDRPLGTAGALGKLGGKVAHPILVLNGDLLTEVDFAAMMDFHVTSGNEITVGTRLYRHQVPYGVALLEGDRMTALKEKPTYDWLVSAGIYCLSPSVLGLIPSEEYCDMPDLLSRALEAKRVGAYPIHEYWADIGHLEDYHRANNEWRGREKG